MDRIVRFAGHFVEGNQPAFPRSPVHLVLGPLLIVARPFVWPREKVTGRKVWKADRLKHAAA